MVPWTAAAIDVIHKLVGGVSLFSPFGRRRRRSGNSISHKFYNYNSEDERERWEMYK